MEVLWGLGRGEGSWFFVAFFDFIYIGYWVGTCICCRFGRIARVLGKEVERLFRRVFYVR